MSSTNTDFSRLLVVKQYLPHFSSTAQYITFDFTSKLASKQAQRPIQNLHNNTKFHMPSYKCSTIISQRGSKCSLCCYNTFCVLNVRQCRSLMCFLFLLHWWSVLEELQLNTIESSHMIRQA